MGGAAPILIVEDEPHTREAFAALLELQGYQVVGAGDGQEALEQLRSGLRPGLIILDLMMPRMDGFQFRHRQMQDPALAEIPVIIYSARFEGHDRAVLLGAVYLEKPFDLEKLLEVVHSYYPLPQPN